MQRSGYVAAVKFGLLRLIFGKNDQTGDLALLNVGSIMDGLRRYQLPTFSSFLLCLTVVIKGTLHPNIKILSTFTEGDSDLFHKITVIGDGCFKNDIKKHHDYGLWWI